MKAIDLAGLRVLHRQPPHSLRLRSARACVELSSFAPDVIRLRAARGRQLPATESFAVVEPAPRPGWQTVFGGHDRAVLRTNAASLSIEFASGRWTLRDAHDRTAFDAIEIGFSGTKPHLTFALPRGQAIHGLGEMTGPLDRRGLVREFWNMDVLGHASCLHAGLRSSYVSIPFALTLHQGRAAGLFWDNPSRQVWDMGCTNPDRWEREVR